MTLDKVRDLLRKRPTRFANRKGSTGVTAWASAKGVNKSHVSEFLAGKRLPTTDILDALGLQWTIARKPKEDTHG